MFIIFGTPRSGTTLVAATLNQNDQIVVPDETDCIVPTAFILDRVKNPVEGRRLIAELIVKTERFPASLGKHLHPDEIVDAVAGAEYSLAPILEAIYSRIALLAGRLIAGDKSPNDLVYVRMLLKNGLAASPIKVVHLVRDIRDVLMSLAEAQPQDAAELNLYFARSWAQSNLLLQDMYAEKRERYFFLRYEDLAVDPERWFTRMSDFLGVPFQEKMLDPATRGVGLRGFAGHRHLGEPIRQRRGDWRTAMAPELKARCLVQAREAFERFGYPLD
jgi:hypothetical protein